MVSHLSKILDAHETLYYLANTQAPNEQNHSKLRKSFSFYQKSNETDVDIWSVDKLKSVKGKTNEYLGGNLNDIITKLTAEQGKIDVFNF